MPSHALYIFKLLTRNMRVQCLEMVFQTIFHEVCLLHEKEDWDQEITGDFYWLFANKMDFKFEFDAL